MILATFHSLLENGWKDTFARQASLQRAIELATATVCVFGKRMISRIICALGRQLQDWSADYKIFSRSPWDEDSLFEPIIDSYLERFPHGPITMPLDDTVLKKTGQKIVDRNRPVAKAAPKRKTKQSVYLMRNKFINAGANVVVTTGSAVGSTILVNKIPWVKDRKPWQKGGGQAILFLLLSFAHKNLWWKKATLGASGGGAITALLPWLTGQGWTPFSGPKNGMTPYQKARLNNSGYSARSSYSGPVDQMGGPVDRMGGPVDRMGGPPMYSSNTFQSVQNPRAY